MKRGDRPTPLEHCCVASGPVYSQCPPCLTPATRHCGKGKLQVQGGWEKEGRAHRMVRAVALISMLLQ